jgi:hypothetical protein
MIVHMGHTLTLLLAMLATARLTRLVTTDRVFLAPRRALLRRLITRYGEDHLLPYLVTCDWCVSIYTGSAVASAWIWAGHTLWFQVPAAALAFSYAAGFLATREGE